MKLIYTDNKEEVTIGDMVDIRGIKHEIIDITPPHKPSASGHVYVRRLAYLDPSSNRYYVGVIGAEWIDREDRE